MRSKEKIIQALLERDLKDAKIEEENRKKLISQGLEIQRPKRIIEIDSGKIEGVNNVVNLILKEIKKEDRIISIEGQSGVGKSATAASLGKKIQADKFSMGEIFRYLTYKKEAFKDVTKRLNYRILDGKIYLFDNDFNVTKELKETLRSPEIEKRIPEIAIQSQEIVIRFVQKELKDIKKRILIEGRSFTLDFLPTDLRIKLFADVSIRARRRL